MATCWPQQLKQPIINIQLKKIKYLPSGSQETNCFTADLYIEGQKVATIHNNGCGGNTNINSYHPDNHKVIAQTEEYCKGLPAEDLGDGLMMKMNLEYYVDNLFEQWLEEKEKAKELTKFLKKQEKFMVDHLVIGKRNEMAAYKTIKFGKPIAELLGNPELRKIFAEKLKVRAATLEAGESILNNNIPQELYHTKKDQYDFRDIYRGYCCTNNLADDSKSLKDVQVKRFVIDNINADEWHDYGETGKLIQVN